MALSGGGGQTKGGVSDQEALLEVPTPLKKLVRIVSHSFYGVECFLLMDMLIRNPCMKEDDLLEVLKFDKKMLRSHVGQLRSEHFLKARIKVETDGEGRATKHNYYFINYTGLVNVVKFKLHHIHQKLQAQERDSTSRMSFKCAQCTKGYTDMEADRLFDPTTGTFVCMVCQADLEEEQSEAPVQDVRALIARFNDEIEPIYELLRQCEDYRLSREILEPEPSDVAHLTEERRYTTKVKAEGERTTWSGDATKNRGFGYSQGTVTVNVGDDAVNVKKEADVKEQPVWMKESTVDGTPQTQLPTANPAPVVPPPFHHYPQGSTATPTPPLPPLNAVPSAMSTLPGTAGSAPSSISTAPAPVSSAIMQTLLIHEKKGGVVPGSSSAVTGTGVPTSVPASVPGGAQSSSDSSDEDDEPRKALTGYGVGTVPAADQPMEEEETEEEEAVVMIGGQRVPYNSVTSEHIAAMTEGEKAAYIQLGQSLFDAYE